MDDNNNNNFVSSSHYFVMLFRNLLLKQRKVLSSVSDGLAGLWFENLTFKIRIEHNYASDVGTQNGVMAFSHTEAIFVFPPLRCHMSFKIRWYLLAFHCLSTFCTTVCIT